MNTIIRPSIKILEDNGGESDAPYIWLADTYDSLPDSTHPWITRGTQAPIRDNWRSPFIGKSLREVAEFIRKAPSPPKPLDKCYCAVLRKEEYERDRILLCRVRRKGMRGRFRRL